MAKGLEGVATAPPLAVAGVTAGADPLAGEATAGTYHVSATVAMAASCWIQIQHYIKHYYMSSKTQNQLSRS